MSRSAKRRRSVLPVQPLPASGKGGRRASASTSHEGASHTFRDIRNWNPLPTSADAEILPELGTLVSRSADLERNNGIAQSGIQSSIDNIVGVGLRLKPMPDYQLLGKDKAWADEWAQNTSARWRSWAETTDCDASRTLNFNGLTTQIARAGLSRGEGCALPLWLPSRQRRYATCIQLIESSRVSNPEMQMDTNLLRAGVAVDSRGAPQGFWVQNQNPGDAFWIPTGIPAWEYVPAYTSWGRRKFIHVHDRERTGQTRGKPALTAILRQFKLLDRYTTSELEAAVINAMIAAFIESPMDHQGLSALFGEGDEGWKNYQNGRADNSVKLQGGSVIPLFPGEKLQSFAPNRPSTAFDGFTTSVLRHIAAGLNMPMEVLMKDFSKTNYSSARAALLEGWRYFLGRRAWLATYWAGPVYELWLEEAINKGDIEAPDYYDNRYAYNRCAWIGPGKGWIDPVKEAQAAYWRLFLGISSLETEAAEQGMDWRELADQRAVEQAYYQARGMTPPWMQAPVVPPKLVITPGAFPSDHNGGPPLDDPEDAPQDGADTNHEAEQ